LKDVDRYIHRAPRWKERAPNVGKRNKTANASERTVRSVKGRWQNASARAPVFLRGRHCPFIWLHDCVHVRVRLLRLRCGNIFGVSNRYSAKWATVVANAGLFVNARHAHVVPLATVAFVPCRAVRLVAHDAFARRLNRSDGGHDGIKL